MRLRAVAAMVPEGAGSVADVGAGDGQLSRELATRGCRVIATERTAASFERLRDCSPGLDCRLGDGLTVLSPTEVEGVVLAGMGGHTISRILASSADAVRTLGWLVLQPQQNPFQLAAWLNGAGFHTLAAEQAVDRGRWYTVLLVKPPDDGS